MKTAQSAVSLLTVFLVTNDVDDGFRLADTSIISIIFKIEAIDGELREDLWKGLLSYARLRTTLYASEPRDRLNVDTILLFCFM